VHNYLAGALLPKVDRMTMAHSLEARSPFLDHEVMELAARLSVTWKVKRQCTKRLLRELFVDLLPATVLKRGKAGFGLPLGMWFREPLYQSVTDLLLAPDTRLCDYLRRDGVADLIEEHKRSQADHGKRIWALLNLEVWLRQQEGAHVSSV
jgi:asparagine synthase (glutamine-hydrolysing)